MIRRTLLPLTALCLMGLALGGCETLVKESAEGAWIEIQPGSALVLERPVRIPPGQARAYLSRGAPGAGGATCTLEVRRIDHERPQTIAAGRLPITRTQNYVALVSRTGPSGEQTVWFRLARTGDGDGSQMVRFGFHFWLDGSHDPNVMRLTCLGRHDTPAYTRPPTLTEIQAALGDQARLELATAEVVP